MIVPVSATRAIGAADAVTGVGATAPAAAAGTSFSAMLAEVASGAVSNIKAGEATAISGITGKASVQQVVESVMQAEQSLQTALAIRDKLVTAYQEISRMAI